MYCSRCGATLAGGAEVRGSLGRRAGRVPGVHVVGPDAGEITQGFAVALKCGASKRQFDATIGIHPTIAEELVTMRDAVL